MHINYFYNDIQIILIDIKNSSRIYFLICYGMDVINFSCFFIMN